MTNQITSRIRMSFLAGAVAVASLLSAPTVHAQAGVLTAKVPFGFQAGKQQFPAGHYRVDLQSHMITLRSQDSNAVGYVLTIPQERAKQSDTGKLVFHRYGSQYFLADVWTPGTTGLHCPTTRSEKQMQIAQRAIAPTNTVLALNR